MSLESLRFMLGGAIKRPTAQDSIIVRHTEEVVCKAGGVVPKPTDHLTGVELTPTATYEHPIRLINMTTGARTQLVVTTENGAPITIDGTKAINFVNPAMQPNETNYSKATAYGDHVRIFWEEVIVSESSQETAIEVTISPDTLKNPGEVSLIKITNCWELLNEDNQQLRCA